LLFLCGYPSFFIYLNYIIGFSFIVWAIYNIRHHNKGLVLKTFFHLGIAYLFVVLICSPAIISYYEFLPYYSRGSGITYQKAIENPLVPFSLSTYALANVGNKAGFLPTDLSMRNTYIGLFIFLFFLMSLRKITRFKTIILFFTIFSLLFSLGDLTPVQKLAYRFLPMINTFRHPGTMRVFTSIGMIILAAYSIDHFFSNERNKRFSQLCYLGLALLAITCIYFFVTMPQAVHQIHFSLKSSALKQILYELSFEQFALIICLFQVIFICGFLFLQQKKISKRLIALLFILNSIVFAWIGLPFGVVSQYKTSEVNNYIHSFHDGYPIPNTNASIESEVYSDSIPISLHGYHNFYNKRIVVQDHIITPTLNSDYYRFLEDHPLRAQLKDHPFLFVTADSVAIIPADISILKFTPNGFVFEVKSKTPGKLQLFQQFNPNWTAKVNRNPVDIKKSNIAFMSVNMPAGTSIVEWEYRPKKIYAAMVISMVSLMMIVFYFMFIRKNNTVYE
jgi:hypothetical protein